MFYETSVQGACALDPTWLRGFGEAPASVNKNGFVMLVVCFHPQQLLGTAYTKSC